VTETAFFYFEGGPPSDYYDGAEKCLRTWAEKADGLLSWAVGTTYEDVEEDGIKGKAVILSLGWQTKEHHVEFNKTDFCKEHGKALVSSSKKLTAWYVHSTTSGTSWISLTLLQARSVLEVPRMPECVRLALRRSMCVLLRPGESAMRKYSINQCRHLAVRCNECLRNLRVLCARQSRKIYSLVLTILSEVPGMSKDLLYVSYV